MPQTSLVIKRIFNATCQELFAAWSKPELMRQWLFPLQPGWQAIASNDFQVGGQYQQIMLAEDGTSYNHTGIYKEIVPNQKLVFTWNSDSVNDTLVTVELRAIDGKTELTLTHELLPNEVQRESHQGGWEGCLDNLEKFLVSDSYSCVINYQAPLEKVYQALTKEEGLKNWWTQDCTIGAAEVGEKFVFRFDANYKVMKIKELIPNKKIIWECVEHHYADKNLKKTNEWVGTEIIFRLSKNSDGNTVLYFMHPGLSPELECFNHCQQGWNYFLKESLKAYLETGVGKPYGEEWITRSAMLTKEIHIDTKG